jgi:signal transduction histidine kinase
MLVLDERVGMISGDSERLQQVMWNLISNAIKFTPKGGRVQVVLGRAESHVEVSVVDNGIGIDPAFLPHVFEPFRQENAGSMRRHSGLGLDSRSFARSSSSMAARSRLIARGRGAAR